MTLSQQRIHTPGQTPHAHEREARDFMVGELPDADAHDGDAGEGGTR